MVYYNLPIRYINITYFIRQPASQTSSQAGRTALAVGQLATAV